MMCKIDKINEVKKEYGDNYKVIYWATEERRDIGESDIYEMNMPLEEAVYSAKKLVSNNNAASAEVRADNSTSDLNDKTVFYCGPDGNDENYVEEWYA